jgi:glycosyltransferase involved in cell wall biosynthesis
MGMTGLRGVLNRPRLRRLIRGADVVHVHRERALGFVLRALPPGPPPFALVGHRGNSNPLSARHRALLADPRVDVVVAVAREVRDILVEGGLAPERVRVIYGSVDTEAFRPGLDGARLRRDVGVEASAPLVGLLANLDGKKDHGTFLAAAARVRRERPETRFVLVGGGDEEPFRRRAAELGLGEVIRFAGFREDAAACLAAFDVSVNCSDRGEGLTGAVRESLAMARPVVCTRVGGNAELVEDGRTGRLVEPGDPEALAEAILWTLAHPGEAAVLAARGRETVLREMRPEVRQARLEGLYREILARKAASGTGTGDAPHK